MAALLATDESGNQATSSDALLNRADAAIEQAKLLQAQSRTLIGNAADARESPTNPSLSLWSANATDWNYLRRTNNLDLKRR
jgi:hypothetical protein